VQHINRKYLQSVALCKKKMKEKKKKRKEELRAMITVCVCLSPPEDQCIGLHVQVALAGQKV